jgi:toxin ParE1/3/4
VGRVTRTRQANLDLDDIWLQIALDNVSAADRLIDQITGRCLALADHPRLGSARPEIAPDARMLVIGDDLALYRLNGDGVQIVRVVHGARQLEGLFDADPEA